MHVKWEPLATDGLEQKIQIQIHWAEISSSPFILLPLVTSILRWQLSAKEAEKNVQAQELVIFRMLVVVGMTAIGEMCEGGGQIDAPVVYLLFSGQSRWQRKWAITRISLSILSILRVFSGGSQPNKLVA